MVINRTPIVSAAALTLHIVANTDPLAVRLYHPSVLTPRFPHKRMPSPKNQVPIARSTPSLPNPHLLRLQGKHRITPQAVSSPQKLTPSQTPRSSSNTTNLPPPDSPPHQTNGACSSSKVTLSSPQWPYMSAAAGSSDENDLSPTAQPTTPAVVNNTQ